jgi:tetratricopeptide (TPR) repeat protein
VQRRYRTALKLLGLPLLLLLVGCPPTLSKPRGEGYEEKLAEAARHQNAGRLEAATEAYAEASRRAERRVDQDEARYRQARAMLRSERYEEAVRLLDRIGDRKPPSRRTGRAIFDAARIRYEQLEQYAQAKAGFERVIREFPDEGLGGRAIYFIIEDFRRQDELAAALPYLDARYREVRATTLGDDVLWAKAALLREREERDAEQRTLERLVRNHPYPMGHNWDEAIMRLAEIHLEREEPKLAIEVLEKLVVEVETTTIIGSYVRSTMPKAYMWIGTIYRDELGDRPKADRVFGRFHRLFPRSVLNDDVRYERGVMWVDAGETDRGCEILKKLVSDYDVGNARRRAEARIESDCVARD